MVKRILRNTAAFLFVWLAISLLANGCVCVVHGHAGHEPRTVYVKTPPPPPKHETKTSKPSSSHVWVEGHWDYNESNDDWEWEDGSWEVPPEDGSTWEKPEYEEQGGKQVYRPGRWKKPDKNKKPQNRIDPKKDKDKDKNRPVQERIDPKDKDKDKNRPVQERIDPKPKEANPTPVKQEDSKPGGASAKPAKDDDKPGGAGAKTQEKEEDSKVVKPNKKCKVSRSCNCDGVCQKVEAKGCADCLR